jgi:hypothetical protein
MGQDYNELNKEELLELARERDIAGRSGLDKEGLVKAHEEYDAQVVDEQSAPDEVGESVDSDEVPAELDAPEEVASPAEAAELVNGLEGESLEAYDELGEVGSATQDAADLSLDAQGPFHLERPENRVVTGAINAEQAAEQEAQRAKLPEGFTGDFPELVSDELANQVASERTVQQEDIIDFPPPLAEQEQTKYDRSVGVLQDANESVQNSDDARTQNVAETQGDRQPVIAQKRTWNQRSQLYTDGVSGTGDHNLERAYLQADIRAGLHETVLDSNFPPHQEALEAEKARKENEPDYNR